MVVQACNDDIDFDVIRDLASRNGFTVHDVPADGDCLPAACYWGMHVALELD